MVDQVEPKAVETAWSRAVLVFSLPALLSVFFLRLLLNMPAAGNDDSAARVLLDWVVLAMFFCSGVVGFFGTFIALVLVVRGSFVRTVPLGHKVMMWLLVMTSLLALLYLASNARP
jgi:hypothetical protein